MKAELVPSNGDPPIPITRDLTVVGRREYCDVQINHESLSKRHCVLVRTDGLLVVRDLASTNGTKVNGQKVLWAALLPNDRLTIGRYKVKVYLGPDDVPSPSEGPRGKEPADKTPFAGSRYPGAPAPPSATLPVGSVNAAKPPGTPPTSDPEVIDGNDLLVDDDDEEPILLELD